MNIGLIGSAAGTARTCPCTCIIILIFHIYAHTVYTNLMTPTHNYCSRVRDPLAM